MKTISKLLLSFIGLVSLSATMFAGTENVLNLRVPFAFAVGGKVLPAGDYRFVEVAETGLVMIKGATTATSMALITTPGDVAPISAERSVKFERMGSTVYLREVILDGRESRLVKIKPVDSNGAVALGGN